MFDPIRHEREHRAVLLAARELSVPARSLLLLLAIEGRPGCTSSDLAMEWWMTGEAESENRRATGDLVRRGWLKPGRRGERTAYELLPTGRSVVRRAWASIEGRMG